MSHLGVVVGINTYPSAPLDGCEDDIEDIVAATMKARHWKHSDFRALVNDRAETQRILDHLETMVAKARDGDDCLFWYSGHGAQYAGRDADQEVDGLLEIICPVDFAWDERHMITDKQLVAIFRKLRPGVKLYWGSDSCHSGGLSRMVNSSRSKPRHYPVPFDMRLRIATAREKGWLTPHISRSELNCAFISGCKSDQTSADAFFDGRPNGAMTHFFLKTWLQSPDAALTVICAEVNEQLRRAGFDQQPQLDGTLTTGEWLQE